MICIRATFLFILLCVLYVLLSVGTSNLFFPYKANGSLIKDNSQIIGSNLIGQEFNSQLFFHNRPSINYYKNNFSGNSNQPYFSKKQVNDVVKKYKKYEIENIKDLNLFSESASGLDPHITYESALLQITRVSESTGLPRSTLNNLIDKNSKRQILFFFGSKITNVVHLNYDLSKLYATKI